MTKRYDASRPLGWAIFGSGGVARKFVLDLAAHAPGSVARVVASRSADNAARFAAGLPVEGPADSYAAVVADDAVDAVYIATPPEVHEAHAMMAIAAGKAVLIEKPFAMDAAAAQRIADAAQLAGVFAMEAMWTRFQPLVGNILAALDRLGDLRGFDGQFCAANLPSADSSLFRADGGGSLMHRGIYPLYLARLFLGEVTDLQAMARLGDTGADEDTAITLRHESGAISTLRSSLRSNGPDGGVIYGTKGTLHIQGPLYRPTAAYIQPTHPSAAGTGQRDARKLEAFRESALGWRISSTLSGIKGRTKRLAIKAPMQGNGYHYQVNAVAAALAADQTECAEMPLADSLRIMGLMDMAKAQWSNKA